MICSGSNRVSGRNIFQQAPRSSSMALPLCLLPMIISTSEPVSDRSQLLRRADQACAGRAAPFWRGHSLSILAPAAFVATILAYAPAAAATESTDPLRFFVGMTESLGTTKVLMHRSIRTSSIGRGQIRPDGSLILVQRVQDEGRAPYLRRWEIRQVGTGRFEGTMSQAAGPVAIVQVGHRYRFTFTMKGHMSVEQWLTPLPGG